MKYGSPPYKRHFRRIQNPFLVLAVTVSLLPQYGAFGQTPTAITSSGLGTVVTTNVNIHDITGGTRPGGASGTNLFHSFGDFSVPANNIANFLNAGSIDLNGNVLIPNLPTSNILGRVTGGDPSAIFGTIQTTNFGSANLFLMNPAGFLFGSNATVNAAGMVAFTTADYLRLSNGVLFNNTPNVAQDALLSAAPVAAFGFLGSNPAAIAVQGSTLQVAQDQSLSFVGGTQGFTATDPDTGNPISVPGGVTMTGGILSAPGGQINLASVASAGEILYLRLQSASNVIGQSFTDMGAITLSQGATLDATGESSGTIRIRSGQFTMDNGYLFAGSFGDVDGARNAVSIDVTNDVLIGNQSLLDATSFGMGRAGDIEIRALNLSLTDGSIVAAQGFGGAEAGNISLTFGNTLSVTGTDSFGNGSLITTSGSGTGTNGGVMVTASDMVIADQGTIRTEGGAEFAGWVTLEVQNLTLSTGGSIQAFGGDLGPSGNIKIVASESISLNGNGDFSTRILSQNVGTGGTGTITIEAGALALSNSSQILSETDVSSGGTAVPKLSITADSVSVSGGSRIDITTLQGDVGSLEISARSVILADRGLIRSSTSSGGNSGSINITADNMALSGGSQINSSTEGTNVTGLGGDISLTVTEKLALAGSFTDESGMVTPTAIQSSTQFRSLGDAGQISIDALTIDISNGALIASRSASGASGNAGNVTVQGLTSPAQSVLIDGSGSGIFTNTEGAGAGGNILVNADSVTLQNGGTLSAITSGTEATATGGTITVHANRIELNNEAPITATSDGAGNAGTITMTANENIVLLGNSSIASAAVGEGNGGLVSLTAPSIEMHGNSNIVTSTAGLGNAGDIELQGNQVNLTESFVTAQTQAEGRGGDITVRGLAGEGSRATDVRLSDNSQLLSETIGDSVNIQGAAGNILVETARLNLSGGSLFTTASRGSTGAAGNITVNATDALTISGLVTRIISESSEFSFGNAGHIAISAPSVVVENNGGISTSTSLVGNAGTITVNTNNLQLLSSGHITSSSLVEFPEAPPSGAAGTVTIQGLAGPAQSALIDGAGSGIFTDTQGTGAGGNIFVNADSVMLTNGATLSASSTGQIENPGAAGNIDITATNGLTMQNGAIKTVAGQGASGGDIKVTTAPSATVLLENSQISASVADGPGGGGNIEIDPQYVILQNSQILAIVPQGQGGTITITANLFMQDANSIVSADSGSGLHGTVTIQSPNAPASGKIQPLGKTPLQATSLLNQHCASLAGGEFSSFTVAGRDSLPTEPGSWLASPLLAAGVGPGIKAEGVKAEGQWLGIGEGLGVRRERLEGMSASGGQVASGQWKVGDMQILSLRQIAPIGFLIQAFAVEGSTSCQS